MNARQYGELSRSKVGLYSGTTVQEAARQVNLTVQSVLKKEELILRQLDSIDRIERERQQVFVPISVCSCL